MTRRPTMHLTGRELEVVLLLCDGLTVKEIANRLDVSPWTVHSHVANARSRTASSTTRQLIARFAARRPRSIERASA